MLSISLFHNNLSSHSKMEKLRKLSLNDSITGLIRISSKDENISQIIETSIIDIILNTPWNNDGKSIEVDFSHTLDKINTFLSSIRKNTPKIETIDIFFGVIYEDILSFSIIGNSYVYLIQNEKISLISDGMCGEKYEFCQKSSGAIDPESCIFISNITLLNTLTKQDLIELGNMNEDIYKGAIEPLIEREITEGKVDIARIANIAVSIKKSPLHKIGQHIEKVRPKISAVGEKILKHPKTQRYILPIKEALQKTQEKHIQGFLLITGTILCVFLLYYIIDNIYSLRKAQILPQDNQNKLIEVRNIIEGAGKSLASKDIFTSNITKAKKVLNEVKDTKQLLKETEDLESQIIILEKQFNGIETIDISKKKSDLVIIPQEIQAIKVFEAEKKVFIVGKEGVFGPNILGSTDSNVANKGIKYPDSEEAIDADMQNGVLYILTKTNRILMLRKNEFTYVNVTNQTEWENALHITLFDDKLYLISSDGTQIYRHKPGLNGFSQKAGIIEGGTKNYTILDLGIEGAIYSLKNTLMIDKIVTSPKTQITSLKINGIPGNGYELKEGEKASIFLGKNLNYFYILAGKKIWIFKPDSRNYKDLSSLQYIGQLEVSSTENLSDIFIPFDGTIRILLESGLYTVSFDIVENKLILR